jgi:hypothetical protein
MTLRTAPNLVRIRVIEIGVFPLQIIVALFVNEKRVKLINLHFEQE